MKAKRVYLAGPDVFLPEAVEVGQALKALCASAGLEGLYPLDNDAPTFNDPHRIAQWIAQANIALIHQADYVVANLNNFRGLEPDSGTCFEVGMAIALGKPVFIYLSDHRPMVDKVPHDMNNLDDQGNHVENFDLPINLMLACTAQGIYKDAKSAIQAAGAFAMKEQAHQ
jgi:nucleoside 2-deoxyribosyltransferase